MYRDRSIAVVGAVAVLIGGLGVAMPSMASAHSFSAARSVPSATVPEVEGPIPGPGLPQFFAQYSLPKLGYEESEFFFSGTATSYAPTSALSPNGRWSIAPATSASYKSRLIVIRPRDPSHFSGTVVVEWLNVSGGTDAGVDWGYAHDEMIRSGDAYVGVTAQVVGLNSAKSANPARYASLVHPGDQYSYDMFSQAGMAVRDRAATVLGGLHPRRVIADGESQSAIRLTTYVDAVAPLVHVYDGYLIHSRSAGAAGFTAAESLLPGPVFIRTDLDVPVLTFATETDVLGILDFYPAVQRDSRYLRLWEVAGTAHADSYLITLNPTDNTSWAADTAAFSQMSSPQSSLSVSLAGQTFSLSCTAPFNTGEEHYTLQTALHDLTAWVQTGVPPRSMPRFDIDTSSSPPSYVLDAEGNVKGGVRSPAVDVPLATESGLSPGPGASQTCVLFGHSHPLSLTQLSRLYPTRATFVQRWRHAVSTDLAAGYLLPADAKRLDAVVGGS